MKNSTISERRHVLSFLSRRYKKRGWLVYAHELEGAFDFPQNWNGPEPDMVIVRRNERVAVFVENNASLQDAGTFEKWQTMQQLNNVKILVVVRDSESLNLARTISQQGDITLITELVTRSPKKKGSGDIFKDSKVDRTVIILILVVVLGIVLLYGKEIRRFLQVSDYYRPFDGERQEHYFKEKEKEEANKEASEKIKEQLERK